MINIPKDLVRKLERKNSIFVYCISLWAHAKMFEEATGFGYKHAIFHHKGEDGALCFTRSDIERGEAYFQHLIKSGDKSWLSWYERGIETNKRADELIEEFGKSGFMPELAAFEDFLKEFKKIFLFSTVLPYWVLNAINADLEKGTDGSVYKDAQERFEELRGQTRYPQLAEKVLAKYFQVVADKFGGDPKDLYLLTPHEFLAFSRGEYSLDLEEFPWRRKSLLGVNDFETEKIEIVYDSYWGIDWEKYLERKQPIFLFSVFNRAYGELLEQATGFRFSHQLQTFSNDTGTFYRSKSEMRDADDYYLRKIETSDSSLGIWRDKAVEAGRIAEVLVTKARSGELTIHTTTVTDIVAQCEDIILYDTVIPYRVLSAINSATDADKAGEHYSHALEMFESFRARAQYPELAAYVFPLLWAEAARVAGIRNTYDMSLCTSREIVRVIKGEMSISQEELERRRSWCAFWEHPRTGETIFSFDKYILESLGEGEGKDRVKEFMGSIAYKGKARGKAKIVNAVSDMDGFNEGDILVSINTNPALMSAISKCAGIVTDEGGIMCHAAIVSRELKKPCVIGTKIATRSIRNGDMVEVDAEKGIVRVLS